MNQIQIASLLDTIQISYPGKFNTQNPQGLLDSWERILRKHDYKKVIKNFEDHLERSPFPPTVADLVKARPIDRLGAIPNADETLAYLKKMEQPDVLSEEQIRSIEESKAEIRKILMGGA